jgi:release factor glutamine methyltransferase
MKVHEWLKQAIGQLEPAGVGTARLDALVLLEDCLNMSRAHLLAEPDMELSTAQLAKLKKLLTRRATHEPLAYIRGHTEFYGRDFVITSAVLEPRPESETMIDALKALPAFNHPQKVSGPRSTKNGHTIRIADVGTGSGALGITAALEVPRSRVDLLDIDSAALKVAKRNVDKFTLNMSVIQSDLLSKSSQDYDILLCNLPYVPDSHTINEAAMFEPRVAIFGGPDGLALYHKLFGQISKLAKKPLYILTESLPPQHKALQQLAKRHGYKLKSTDDFIQVFDNN